jgi:hypothetical protein
MPNTGLHESRRPRLGMRLTNTTRISPDGKKFIIGVSVANLLRDIRGQRIYPGLLIDPWYTRTRYLIIVQVVDVTAWDTRRG